jgi:hypothetical protein
MYNNVQQEISPDICLAIFRTILMKMICKDGYEIIGGSMADSNIEAR